MVIVEGPDGAGKTTMVKRIVERYQLPVGTRRSPRDRLFETTVEDTFDAIAASVNPNNWPAVWDRMFWSELIYAPIMGRKCAFSTSQIVHITRVFELYAYPVIWCLPPYDVVLENCRKTEQHEWVEGNVHHIWDSYKAILDHPYGPTKKWMFDYTRDDPRDVLAVIGGYLDRRQELAA